MNTPTPSPPSSPEPSPDLTHVDQTGASRMVDVSAKPATLRQAVAQARVTINSALAEAIGRDMLKKGNLIEVARLAGIQAAKRTADLIPLCHPLPIDAVTVDVRADDRAVHITAQVRTTWKTGVEMEALTCAAVAGLTVIDMGKAIDPGMVIEHVELLEKTGGQRGDYRAAPRPSTPSAS